MDPIPIFKNTQRSISLGFKVIADTLNTTSAVTEDLNLLIKNLYPKYVSNDNIKLLNSAPLAKIKFGNLITNSHSGRGSATNTGLAGYITDFSASPDLEQGYMGTAAELFPKQWNISFSFQVLHDQTPGWEDSDDVATFMINNGGFDYPYGGIRESSGADDLDSAISALKPKPKNKLAQLENARTIEEILT